MIKLFQSSYAMKKILSYLKYYYHSSQFYQIRLVQSWKTSNQHKIKENAIIEYCDKFHYRIFIETGTYVGEMVYALKNKFDTLYTIELSVYLFKTVKKRLGKIRNIQFYQGDSGEVLSTIINQLPGSAIFWLDGHYSGGSTAKGETETPILKELQSIYSSPFSHIILIDDARCFGNPDLPEYPSIKELEKYIHKLNPKSRIEIKDDIIRLMSK
jgi:hypothetical protein